jgi:hypothetical protein
MPRTSPSEIPRGDLIAHFTYFETPDILGGDVDEHSLVLTSAVAKRGRRVDPRTAAYEWLMKHVSHEDVFDRPEVRDVLEWSDETMGGNVAAVTSTQRGFELLQEVLHRAGYSGVTLEHSSKNLLSYLD